jgi:hypothetical protein
VTTSAQPRTAPSRQTRLPHHAPVRRGHTAPEPAGIRDDDTCHPAGTQANAAAEGCPRVHRHPGAPRFPLPYHPAGTDDDAAGGRP